MFGPDRIVPAVSLDHLEGLCGIGTYVLVLTFARTDRVAVIDQSVYEHRVVASQERWQQALEAGRDLAALLGITEAVRYYVGTGYIEQRG